MEKTAVFSGFARTLKNGSAQVVKGIKAVAQSAVKNTVSASSKIVDNTSKAKDAITLASIKAHNNVADIADKINPGAAKNIAQASFSPMIGATEIQIAQEVIGGALHHGKKIINKIIKK